MSAINQNRYDQLIRRVADLQGPGSKVNDVLTELFPMFDVENMPGELLLLAGTAIAHGGGTIVSAVATAPTAQLFNTVDSGHLITITGVRVAFTATSTVRWGVQPIARGTEVATEIFRDSRRKITSSPVGQVRQEAVAALAAGTNQTRVLANTTLFLEDENGIAVLAPGGGFEIGSAAGVNTLFYSFYWRERAAEPSELNL